MEPTRDDELLSAYLDRELSPDERAAVERWLDSSSDARDRLRGIEATSRFVRALPCHGLDAAFADGVMDRLRSESALRPAPPESVPTRRRIVVRVGVPIGLAASLLIAVWVMQPPGRRSLPPANSIRTDMAPLPQLAESDESLLKVGDVLAIFDPAGRQQFELVVLATAPEPDTIRCILGESAPRETADRHASGAVIDQPPVVNRMSIEADNEQLVRLTKLLDQSAEAPESPVPFVDIQLEPEGVRMAALDVDGRSKRIGTETETAAAAEAPAAPAADSLGKANASRLAQSGTLGADPATAAEPRERSDAPTRTETPAKSASRLGPETAPPTDSARNPSQQASRRTFIKELAIKPSQESASAAAARTRTTRDVVEGLAKSATEARTAPSAVPGIADDLSKEQQRRRVEVLLRFRNDRP